MIIFSFYFLNESEPNKENASEVWKFFEISTNILNIQILKNSEAIYNYLSLERNVVFAIQ